MHRMTNPVMNKTRFDKKQRGYCQECGKDRPLRNSDGMMVKHIQRLTKEICIGSGMPPSISAASMYNPKWVPARRSN